MLGGLAQNAVVDRYTIERTLGSGAFGTVYAARDSRSGQLVALKQLSRLSPDALSRFKHEFRAVQGLNHPHIVRLDALIEHESGWLIAMELVEGHDLLRYVRRSHNDPTFGEARLREAFGQLAEALSGLHEHGILHRDVKPANVRVAPDGRVVLLDFGLVTGVSGDAQSTQLGGAGGTAAYMAPEQATGRAKLTAAADWYGFGVCLYEALTGTLPFQADSAMAVLFAKQSQLPPRPSERIGARLPEDLEGLCMALLATDPADRPTAEEIGRILSASEDLSVSGTASAGEIDASEGFQGREVELEQIFSAHAKARSQGLRMLLVEAESGMGKSALVAEWLKRLKAREPGALILKSQCYESEYTAFKAFDAGMEALGSRLDKLSGHAGQLLLPPHAGLLPLIFPALASVRALTEAPVRDVPADPTSVLRCALIALAKLLESFSAGGSVVLVIDDLQWADAESFQLLKTVSEAPHAPRLLVLGTVRPESELDADVTASLALLRTRMPVERLLLEGLSRASCEKLACSHLTGSVMGGWLERITTESKGHPLFVSVLSRYAVSQRPSLSEHLSLEAALRQKIDGLAEDARALLELLALASVPCSLRLLSCALSMEPEQVQKRAAELVKAKLLRRLPHQQLACFHDRVRGIVFVTLGEARKLALHQALGDAIAQDPDHDPALLAVHREGTGQLQAALSAHQQAGDRALAAFAFGNAEHHYARALHLAARCEVEPSLVTTLGAQRGHALARSGRSALAAQQYLAASEHADTGQRIELRVWAAQHLLQSVQVEAGLQAAREVLAELSIPLPKSDATALASIVWDRVCLGLRGLELPRGASEAGAAERTRLDAMWNLAGPVQAFAILSGATLTTRHLRCSLSAGDREHAARALAQEAMFATMQDPTARERPNKLFERARTLYDAEQQPLLEAFVLCAEGTAAQFLFELERARDKLAQAEVLTRVRSSDQPWFLTNVRSALSVVWWGMGELGTHLPDLERWIAEATEREDRYAVPSLEMLGCAAMRFLLRDEPELARGKAREVMASWPREPFAFVHMGELSVMFTEAMYRGGDAAWRYLETERTRHEGAFFFKSSFGKLILSGMRAQAALAACVAAPQGAPLAQYLAAARTEVRAQRRSKLPIAKLAAPVIAAQLAALDGDLTGALELVLAAAAESTRLGHGLGVPPLGYLEGVLEGGDAGREKRARALALAAAQGWKNPRRAVAGICPIVDYLEAKSG